MGCGGQCQNWNFIGRFGGCRGCLLGDKKIPIKSTLTERMEGGWGGVSGMMWGRGVCVECFHVRLVHSASHTYIYLHKYMTNLLEVFFCTLHKK